MVLIRHESSNEEIGTFFQHCQEKEEYVDICLAAQASDGSTTRILTHSLVLAAVSPVLKDVLSEAPWNRGLCFNRSCDVVIVLPEVEPEDLTTLIQIIYSNTVNTKELSDSVTSVLDSLKIEVNVSQKDIDNYIEVKPEEVETILEESEVEEDGELDLVEIDPSRLQSNSFIRIHSNLLTEIKTDPLKNSSIYQCPNCDFKDKSNQKIQVHFRSVHEERKKYQCSECGQGFSLESQLKHHYVSHTKSGIRCNKCGKLFQTEMDMKIHLRKNHHPSDPIVCYVCQKEFEKPRRMKHHVSLHEKPLDFSCDLCTAKFKYQYQLDQHRISVHDNSRNWKCSMCDKSFKLKNALGTHVRFVHEKRFRIICMYCKSGFESREKLRRHLSRKVVCSPAALKD